VLHRFQAAQEAWRILISGTVFFFLSFAITGCGSDSSVAGNQTATPAFSPGAGSYSSVQSVKISSATSGAVLYCTTDGTTPTTSSSVCASTTTVSKTQFLQAIAKAPGMDTSAVMSAGYTIGLKAVDAPVFSPAGGNYTSQQNVTITDAVSGVNIFYTVDGSTPTTASTAYSGPITLNTSQTLNAIAVASGYSNSSVATASYSFSLPPSAPTFNPGSATLRTSTSVTISADSGAAIYYTTDGSIPPASPTTVVYSAPVTVSQGETINAVAEVGTQTSSMSSAAYSFVGSGSVSSPTVLVGGKTALSGSTVRAEQDPITLADAADTNAQIYYTYDGSQPYISNSDGTTSASASATHYTKPFLIPLYYATKGSVLIRAFALDSGTGSSESDLYYLVAQPSFAYPVFTPASGSVLSMGQSVTLALNDKTDTYATIYYSVDGSTSLSSSNYLTSASSYSSALLTTASTGTHTIQAIAIEAGNDSPILVSATYFVGTAGTSISGTVSSAGSAISGAQVQLYAAGYEGYGKGAVALGSPVNTKSDGSFTVSGYTCPPAPLDQIYLVATGGTEGSNSSANGSIALMTALGSCSSSSLGTATVNEVTTIASVYALAPFAAQNSSGGGIEIGAPGTGAGCNSTSGWKSTKGQNESCNYIGLKNAFKTVNNLVNVTWATDAYGVAAGAARSITPAYANGNTPRFGTDGTLCTGSTSTTNGCNINYPAVAYLNSSTVPMYRINALADMLATCVENSSECPALIAGATTGAVTTTSTLSVPNVTPIDTLQAALNIAQNPGNNVSTLLGLVSSMASQPYSTGTLLTQTTPPVDLALALTFTGAGLGINPNTIVSGKGTLTTTINSIAYTHIMPSNDTALSVDASGNVWVAADVYSKTSAFISNTFSPFLAVFDNLGTPLTTPTTVSGTVATFGGFSPNLGGKSELEQIAFDQTGNLWVAETGSASVLDEITGFPSSLTSTTVIPTVAGMSSPGSIAVDGNIASGQTVGNLWFSNSSSLWEVAPEGTYQRYMDVAGIEGEPSFGYMVFDSYEDIWATTGYWPSTLKTEANDFVEVASAPSSPSSPYSFGTSPVLDGYSSGESSKNTASPIADGNGNVYLCADSSGIVVDTFTAAGLGKVSSFTPTSGRGCGQQMVLDGQGHLFAVMNSTSYTYLSTAKGSYLDEFTTTGAQILPLVDAYPGSSSVESPTLAFPISTTGISAMDASGNLWVLNGSTNGSEYISGVKTATPANVLVEFVGIGAPVVTPTSVALSSGLLGQRP